MNDTISARIRRIITGTANSIVTKIEGLAPETILEQAIDEVDNALDEIRAELGRVMAQKHHVTKTISKLNEEHHAIEEQVAVAYKEGREDLLETAMARQVDIEDQLPALENQLTALSGQERELNQAITGVIAKRGEMEDELFDYRETMKKQAMSGDQADTAASGGGSPLAKAEIAENAFTRVMQNATGVRRGTIRASNEESAKLVELAELNRKAKIETKLQALKSRLADPGK